MSDELRELEREQAWQQLLELQRRALLRVLRQRSVRLCSECSAVLTHADWLGFGLCCSCFELLDAPNRRRAKGHR